MEEKLINFAVGLNGWVNILLHKDCSYWRAGSLGAGAQLHWVTLEQVWKKNCKLYVY